MGQELDIFDTDIRESVKSETLQHIYEVRSRLDIIISELTTRGIEHDNSKLEEPEFSYLVNAEHKLKDLTYGSIEYDKSREELAPMLDHHYKNNRHHPEHHDDGIEDMTLIDILEMLCDWKASSMRHDDGNIEESLRHNAMRFGIRTQLFKILDNTYRALGWYQKS